MPQLESAEFGHLDYAEKDVYHFPEGLPGFEHAHDFLLYDPPALAPLQALIHVVPPVLRFYALDWNLVAPDCLTTLTEEDRRALELTPGEPPALRLALVTWLEGEHPTVNLLAPVVLNPTARRGLQVIQFESAYSCRHPLLIERDPCS